MKTEVLLSHFRETDREYSPVPFWFWNDDLKEDHLLYQLNEMKDKGIDEFIIHSRRGRTIEYLSETWFERVGTVLEAASAKGMRVWIYDEDNWPSGYAGERVLHENKSYCAKNLNRYKFSEVLPEGSSEIARDDQYRYVVCDTLWHPAYSNGFYTDMLNADATDSFIRHTHAEYLKRFSPYFQNGTIRGFFVDEPGFYNNFNFYEYRDDAGSIVWTGDLPRYFKEKKGYDLCANLEMLWKKGKDGLRVRMDYWDVVTKMYCENFFGKLSDFCHKAGVLLIGHVHSEEFLPYHVSTQGDLMRAMKMLDYAGIDRIDLTEKKATEKYASSAAHQFCQSRTMSETFATSGLDLNLRRIRQWTNYQYVRGINMLVLHAFFSSVDGDRKFESPPSLFYQNYYWKYFSRYTEYCKRLSRILSEGEYAGCAALYYPIATVVEKMCPDDFSTALVYDRFVLDVAEKLLENQLDYDFLTDASIAKAETDTGDLVINGVKYRFLILPDITEMPIATLRAVASFAKAGGGVVFLGKCNFGCSDGDENEIVRLQKDISNSKRFLHINEFTMNERYSYQFDGTHFADYAEKYGYRDVKIAGGDSTLRYLKREYGDNVVYFFVNESEDKKEREVIVREAGAVCGLNAETGEAYFVESKKYNGGTKVKLCFEPREGILLFVEKGKQETSVKVRPNGLTSYTMEAVIRNFSVEGNGWSANGEAEYWADYGQPYYSGSAVYRAKIELHPDFDRKYFLTLQALRDTAEIYWNGNLVNTLIWEPYRADITSYVVDGENELKMVVSNTTGNAMYHVAFDSGVHGKIAVWSAKKG